MDRVVGDGDPNGSDTGGDEESPLTAVAAGAVTLVTLGVAF